MAIIKANWDNFKAKFDNPRDEFEWFCYLLFCIEHNKTKGIPRYKNQSGIETDPINLDGKIIGWQAKFYDTTLSKHKDDLIKMLQMSHDNYKGINTIIVYTNEEWGQNKNGASTKGQKDVEAKAEKLKIELIWRTASFFESPDVCIKNSKIASHFFCLEDSIYDKLHKIIIPRVKELNEQFKRTFVGINNEFLPRVEVTQCIESLNSGKSVIIHGKAGQGKSGCTQGIITYCEEKDIPYLAIKLDEMITNSNSKK